VSTKSGRVVVEALGWYGLVALLGAYGLVSFSFFGADSVGFQLLNLTGSVTLAILTYFKKAYQNMILNIVWAGISITALLKILLGVP